MPVIRENHHALDRVRQPAPRPPLPPASAHTASRTVPSPRAQAPALHAVGRSLQPRAAAAATPSAVRNQPLSFQIFQNADVAQFDAVAERIKRTPGMYYTSQKPPADAALAAKWAEGISVKAWRESASLTAYIEKRYAAQLADLKQGSAARANFIDGRKAALLAQYIKERLTGGKPSVPNAQGQADAGKAQKVMLDELTGGNAAFMAKVAGHIGPQYSGQWGAYVIRRPLNQPVRLTNPGEIKVGLDALFRRGAILVMEVYPQNTKGTSVVDDRGTTNKSDDRLRSSGDPVAATYSAILKRSGQAKADAYLAAKLQPYADLVAYQRKHHPHSASPVRIIIDARSENDGAFLQRLFHVASTRPALAAAFKGIGPSIYKWDAADANNANPTPADRDKQYVQVLDGARA
jgi:hypothetical protein